MLFFYTGKKDVGKIFFLGFIGGEQKPHKDLGVF
jgi:hypothetical protein